MQLPIPINNGFIPSENSQLSYSELFNMYVAKGMLKRLYTLISKQEASNIISFHYSNYDNGTYLIVTKNQWLTYDGNTTASKVYDYKWSGLPVRFSENKNNEITVADGIAAYVYQLDKPISERVTKLSTSQGFDIKNPVDTIVINTETIIVGSDSWALSSENNALVYNGNDVRVIDASLGKVVGCGTHNNSLFIFGQNGIQRWVESAGATSFNFPFTIDDEFKKDFGAKATNSIQSGNDQLVFLSSDHHIRLVSDSGLIQLTDAGMAEYIKSNYPKNGTNGAINYYNSHYFYSLTLADKSLVYCFESKAFSLSDSDILKASNNVVNDGLVALDDGIYSLSDQFTSEMAQLSFNGLDVNKLMNSPNMPHSLYFLINEVILTLATGESHVDGDEIIELQVSRDNKVWSNRMARNMPSTGRYQNKMKWTLGMSFNRFSLRVTYYGSQDLAIQALDLTMGE